MEEYKIKTKNKIKKLLINMIILIVALILLSLLKNDSDIFKKYRSDMYFVLSCLYFSKFFVYFKALKNPKQLEKMKIAENDERNRLISTKSSEKGFEVSMLLLMFAIIIASYYNITIFITLVIVLILYFIINGLILFYYSRKY